MGHPSTESAHDHLLHLIVLAGGTGQRLGGASKADVTLAGVRLIDRILHDLDPYINGVRVVVAPHTVPVPPRCLRIMEDPPGGGPLAGIGAGMAAIEAEMADTTNTHRTPHLEPQIPVSNKANLGAGVGNHLDELVLVSSVDSPGVGRAVERLLAAATLSRAHGAVTVGGRPQPFRQYLQAIYRRRALAQTLHEAGTLHNRGVRSLLSSLDLVEVPVGEETWHDLDTPEDLTWWRHRLGS